MGYELSNGGIPCVGGSGRCGSGRCGSGLPPIGSGAIVAAVIPENFPVGARAILATPHRDYGGSTITKYKFTSSGRWVTEPGQLEYFSSFGDLAASRDVYQVIDPSTGAVLFPVAFEEEETIEIPELPEFETVDPPPPAVVPLDDPTNPFTWPGRAPAIMRDDGGQWIGYADLCSDRLPLPGTRPFSQDVWADEAERHLAYAREAIKSAADCVKMVGDPKKQQGYDPTYCNLAAVPDRLALAFDFIDEAFCDAVDGYKDATRLERDAAVGRLIDVMHAGLTELRAIIPIIAGAIKRAYAEGYSQGWIDGFAEGYEEGLQDRQDEWDKLLDDLKDLAKHLPTILKVGAVVVGVGALLAFGGWAVSKWKG